MAASGRGLLFSRSWNGLASGPFCNHNVLQMKVSPKGPEAARLRQRKYQLIRRFAIPGDPLPGSLILSHRRCGKPTCHCAHGGDGHAIWYLSFSVQGRKRQERIPAEWVEEVRRRVEAGRAYKDAVSEVFAANAELLVLWRQQRTR